MPGRIIALALLALLSACLRPAPISAPEGAEITPLRAISVLEARALLAAAGVRGIEVTRGVDCYRVIYTAADGQGRPMRLSGLLALPRGEAGPFRLASFQHGTTTTPSAVPSNLDGTGIAAAIVFAGAGYALVAPDYPGLGVSPGPHPYYIGEAIGPSVVGLIDVAQQLDAVSEEPVFLSGFSEGGWATLVAMRMLEAQGRPVLAAAPVAGAFDLRGVSVPAAMQGGARSHALYMAYTAWGQAAYLDHPLDSALTPEQAANVARLFDGASPDEIVAGLPSSPRELFNSDFLNAFDNGGAHWLLESFAANSLADYVPQAPVRLYFGSQDRDVLPEEAQAAARRMAAGGADSQAVDVGPVGHDPSMLAAAPRIRAWLGDLERAARAPDAEID